MSRAPSSLNPPGWAEKKDLSKAIADFDRAWLRTREFDKAIADWSEVIRLDPKHLVRQERLRSLKNPEPEFFEALAAAHAESGDFDAACAGSSLR